MPVFPTSTERNLTRAIIGCALGVTLLLAAAPARAQEETFEQQILDSVMGTIGLSRKAGEGIDYRERSPLVIPPAATLPPPQSDKVANPNWPVDPEIKEARALAAINKKKNDGRTSSQIFDDNTRPLRRSELEKGRTNRPQNNTINRTDDPEKPASSRGGIWNELGYSGGIFGNMFGSRPDDNLARFTGEPPRTSLIEPPSGYQTPAPTQPYAVGKSLYRDKAIDYYGERKHEE